MKTFPLRVLAPERTFFDGACTSLTVPSIDGMYGLMAQHEDIVLAVVPGKLTLRDANIADSTFLAQLHWSSNIYNMMPFVASMVILAFTSKNSMAPKAEGIPYDKGSR